MKFQEKLHQYTKEEIWEEYCGFLNLTTDEFMNIQERLLMEQIELWSSSSLGQSILKGKNPTSIQEFREMVPLTTYEDYSNILLSKQVDALPADPVLWVQTTWEGGVHPIKTAPYTKAMLDSFKHNVISCLILATSRQKGEFDVRVADRPPFLRGLPEQKVRGYPKVRRQLRRRGAIGLSAGLPLGNRRPVQANLRAGFGNADPPLGAQCLESIKKHKSSPYSLCNSQKFTKVIISLLTSYISSVIIPA